MTAESAGENTAKLAVLIKVWDRPVGLPARPSERLGCDGGDPGVRSRPDSVLISQACSDQPSEVTAIGVPPSSLVVMEPTAFS